MRKNSFFISFLVLLALFALGEAEKKSGDPYTAEIEKWRSDRATRLKSDDGWLTVAGLYWLKEGENRFGSDPANQVVFPKGKAPALAGSFVLEKGSVRLNLRPESGILYQGKLAQSMVLAPDTAEEPTILNLGSLSFHIIERGKKFAVRLKDTENPARQSFKGIEYFSVDPKWKVTATFEKYDPPKMIPIANVLGMIEDQPSHGGLVFQMNGKQYRLDPISEEGSDQLFVMFSDQTSGKETYAAGRYLYVDYPGKDGKVIVDFNKAYNPPCVFTPYATCPLPPKQNKLALRVEAGEKKYH